ncbi:hypothetical protein EUGRSUZ_L01726 [Eucalyptus grandis]|uniref:Uncharacterized protein n=1 Tax=Eucalyptus grandis TaxID=71139 RepID=A0A058ZTP5_EUCGR|nr:hypothetical protein EUGRSUZ_L01726 [Eucalyptus grandis]KAK2632314.1 hypothetical protein EUGRSUZ_L01726 [Eucalyptus grandis]
MDLKTPLHHNSSRIDPNDDHHREASIPRFIVMFTFVTGNALAILPTSILRRDSFTFRSLALSIMLAFASAFVSLLLIHCNKAGLAERICRWTSMVAMAAVLVSLLAVSALHQW